MRSAFMRRHFIFNYQSYSQKAGYKRCIHKVRAYISFKSEKVLVFIEMVICEIVDSRYTSPLSNVQVTDDDGQRRQNEIALNSRTVCETSSDYAEFLPNSKVVCENAIGYAGYTSPLACVQTTDNQGLVFEEGMRGREQNEFVYK